MEEVLAAKLIIMKAKTRTFPINIQQGFVIDATSEQIYGAYSHHLKAIIIKESISLFEIPSSLSGYKIHSGITDSFSISAWTEGGHMNLYDIVKTGDILHKLHEALK
jgi:hypothetical protein